MMRIWRWIFCIGATAGFAAAREVPRYSIEDFLETKRYMGASFSPDQSKILVSSDSTGIPNVWAIPVDGGEPQQLTDSREHAIFSAGYFPADERFLYLSDQGGNELSHLYVREADGSVQDLTPGENLKAVFFGWAHDDKTFLVGTNERDRRFFDVYEHQVDGYARELIYQNEDGMNFADLSPDRRYIVLQQELGNADTDLYLLERETGEKTLLTDDPEPVENRMQGFSPDGKWLYYVTNQDHEFSYLVRREVETGTLAPGDKEEWDLVFARLSKRGTYLLTARNRDGRNDIRLVDRATGVPVELPNLPQVDITSVVISDDERRMAFYAGSSRQPGDLYVFDVAGAEPRKLTRSLNAAIDPENLVEGEVLRFRSFDGLEVPGILYRPHGATASEPVPAVVSVHGGPGGQSRFGYQPLAQYLINHGYALYAINNRGSSGYGKTFFHLDDRKHGQDDLDDVVESRKMLAELDWVDGKRIGVMGGSYGGYLTLAALTFRPEVFDVGVDLFGISNWHRTVTNIPPWWESGRKALEQELGDFSDEEFFRAKSPLFHAEKIRRPLMVLQGANDPRVLKVESDEIVEAVKRNGVPVEYVVFDDEGHGFVKKENQATAYRGIREFLDRHLKGEGGK